MQKANVVIEEPNFSLDLDVVLSSAKVINLVNGKNVDPY